VDKVKQDKDENYFDEKENQPSIIVHYDNKLTRGDYRLTYEDDGLLV